MDITPEIFEQQCKRRFGRANPVRMRLEYYEWMVRSRFDPYHVRTELGFEPHFDHGSPDWCFVRFGMSRTRMPDGRVICIAGEHEDFYDPDFCIYNDVIVLRPDQDQEVSRESGGVEIYGYPEDVFPPTDFHSATLIDRKIFVIGRLGYDDTRIERMTPVLTLDPETYEIATVRTTGPCPGWVYSHHASYDAARHAITVRGGKIWVPDRTGETPHFGAHRLHLAEMRWEVIAERESHRRFRIEKAEDDSDWCELKAEAFRPKNVSHLWLEPEGEEVVTYQIDVQGVRALFKDWTTRIDATIEGDLPPEIAEQLMQDIVDNLVETTGSSWMVRPQ